MILEKLQVPNSKKESVTVLGVRSNQMKCNHASVTFCRKDFNGFVTGNENYTYIKMLENIELKP